MIKSLDNKSLGVGELLTQIRGIVHTARSTAYRTANFMMVQAYWNIGRLIFNEEQKGVKRAKYGDKVISGLSAKLMAEFGEGFSINNLKYMRQFYVLFPISHATRGRLVHARKAASETNATALLPSLRSIGHAVRGQFDFDGSPSSVAAFQVNISNALRSKSATSGSQHHEDPFLLCNALRQELTWTHYRLLLKVENSAARDFYIQETIENNWSTRTLDRQISTLYYERILSSSDKKPVRKEASAKSERFEPRDIIKDPYILEFLDLKENTRYLENDLEQALIDKLEDFMLELGKGFAFIARQRRFTADGDHFYADLVFYNYRLRCFFLIDLKIGKLTHQDIGQMDMYVRWFEENEKSPGDNPTIGLILCSEKKEAIAHYSILKESKQIFAAQYRTYLPSEKQLREELRKERLLIDQESALRQKGRGVLDKNSFLRKGVSK